MKKLLACLLLFSLLLTPELAYAVGSGAFENASFSAKAIGQANAVVAQADEAAAISYNPAGITQLKGLQLQTSQDFIGVSTFYKGNNNDTTQSGGTLSYVPTAYMTFNPGRLLNDRLVLGIGTDSPFGLSNKYDSSHPVAHYIGYENAIKMFTVKPVVALKLTDKISIGGGPVLYRVFDVSTKFAYPNSLTGFALPDGTLRANLNGNTWGWQFGVLAKPTEKHQVGFYFRSPANVRLHGRVRVENGGNGSLGLGPRNIETGAHAEMALPLNMTWAYAYKPTKKLTLEADFGYTRWSIHRRLYIGTDPTNAVDDAILPALGNQDKDYSDGYSLHMGTNYQATPKWNVMGGMLFYWASIPADHWNVAIPDSNRLGFTAGTGYDITSWLKFEMAYLASFNLRRKIDNGALDALGQTMDGRYFSYIHGIYLTLTYKWEDLLRPKEGAVAASSSPQVSEVSKAQENELQKVKIIRQQQKQQQQQRQQQQQKRRPAAAKAAVIK